MKTLTKEHKLLSVDKAGPVFTPADYDGWRQLIAGGQAFVSETYFDLAGLSMEEKTLFFDGATIQELQNPSHVGGAAGDLCQIIDIMSSIPLTDTELNNFAVYGNVSPNSIPTFASTIYARNRIYLVDVDFGASSFFNLLSSNQLGSLQPTATDRIYCYRYVLFGANNAGTSFTVTPARYILAATAKEEPTYEYLMRLKRSYDLQNEPDRD